MLDALQLNCALETERIVTFIKTQLEAAGYSQLVFGLSGGVDSALVAALSARAVGAENTWAIALPHASSNPTSEAHSRLVAEQLGIQWQRFDITPAVAAYHERDAAMDARRLGNIMARARMIAWYDLSAEVRGLVVGASNRTETLLGYFTLYGDAGAAFKPIGHLYKAQVVQLARYLEVPEPILAKAPSADLWQDQTDEGELGFTYDEADQVLYLLTECGWSEPRVAESGFDPGTVRQIAQRMKATAFKRELPPMLPPSNPTI